MLDCQYKLCDLAKTVVKGKSIVSNTKLRKEERHFISV